MPETQAEDSAAVLDAISAGISPALAFADIMDRNTIWGDSFKTASAMRYLNCHARELFAAMQTHVDAGDYEYRCGVFYQVI